MHELSITENILAIAVQHANEAGASRVTQINITIGDLSSYVDDSVAFYWNMLSENTLCAGSRLEFTRIPARVICNACENEFELPHELIPCPKCQSFDLQILAGKEFYVDSIEVEK